MNYESRMQGNETVLIEGEAAPRRRWPLIVGAVVAIAALVLAYLFMHNRNDVALTPTAKGGASVPTVTVVVPGRSTVASTVTGTGTIAARREMPVGIAGEGGIVTRVLVEPGSWVGAGQVLASVDRSVQTETAQSLEAQTRVARADASLAQAELDRAKGLIDRGFVSKADLQRKEAARDQASARVRVADAVLSETRARNRRLDIRAPAAGLVLTRGVEPGQIVSSGSGQLFRIAMGGQMEMRAQLAESDLAAVGVGTVADVTPVGSPTHLRGQVWQVSPVIDAQTRQGIARIALKYDPALRPGGFASASIMSGARQAPLLPESAVLSDGRGSFVYVVGAGDKVERRQVTVGAVSDTGVAIASGLAGSERVVLSAGAFLNPGQQVKPQVRASTSAQPPSQAS